MRLGILSRDKGLYSTSRLVEAAEARGHDVRVIDYLRCYMDITARRPQVLLAGEVLKFDAIIPRIGATYTFYGTAVVRQFEVGGTYSVNSSDAIARSRDKLRALQLLSQAGIDLPTTGFAHSSKDIRGLLEVVNGAPAVIKLLEGTQGQGVVLAETRKAAESVIEAFRQLDANILLQEFVKEANGVDLRALVVGGKVVAAMQRRAAAGEFRANLHRGGTAAPAELTDEERETAIEAAQTLGLGVSGVDMLRGSEGPLVIEVNSSPGLEGLENSTGVDVATAVIRRIEQRVNRIKRNKARKDRKKK
jgi:ribosomal protein S6--L-glutamate ligase